MDDADYIVQRLARIEAIQVADAAILMQIAKLATSDAFGRRAMRDELCASINEMFGDPDLIGTELQYRLQIALDRVETVLSALPLSLEQARSSW